MVLEDFEMYMKTIKITEARVKMHVKVRIIEILENFHGKF